MKLNRRLDLLAMLFGLGAAVTGGAGIVGHLAHYPQLLSPTPDLPAIVFAGALALFAGGIAVMAAAAPATSISRRVTVVGGIADAAIGLYCVVGRLAAAGRELEAATSTTLAPVVPVMAGATLLLGACLILLPYARARRMALALTIAATACGLLGATSLAGYLLNVEFMVTWPSSTPLSPHAAFGLACLGAGLCSVVLRQARLSTGAVDEGRSIVLTAVWMLSVIAFVSGVSTFAVAQYEYQNAVRSDLERTLRERRAFLEYAIAEHRQQVGLGARSSLAAAVNERGGRTLSGRSTQVRLHEAADVLRASGFSGWRFRVGDATVMSGAFVEAPDMAMTLSGPMHTELLLKDREYYLRTRAPIHDGTTLLGEALAEEPFPALTKLQLQAEARGETGEMGLCTANGASQMDCMPIRSHPESGRYDREVQGRVLPMSRALDRESGVADTMDYRQHRVLAAYGPVGFTGLGMVIKIDTAEMNAPLGRQFGAAAALLATLVAAGVLLLRKRLQPLTTALVAAREEAIRVAGQFKAAAASSLDGYFLMDAVRDGRGVVDDFRIHYVNASGEVLVGRPSEDITGKTLREVLPTAQANYFLSRYIRIVTTGEALSEEFRTAGSDATVAWVAHQAVKLGDGVSVTARDITRLKSVERQLRSKAENDVLTGLPNRALYFERLTRALSEARQSGFGVGVLFLDVDRFKRINDTYGHAVGDAVLIEFASRLRKLVRRTDTVARLGGDEFAVLLPCLDDAAHAERVAANMLAAVKVPIDAGTIRLHVGTSIGVAFCADGQDTPESLVGRADRSLYNAKAAGRGRYSMGVEKKRAA